VARIRFENVTKYYGSVLAVDKLDLEIRDKEFVVLLGPSGCGKTTTLNMIAGLEELSEGDIWFDDEVVNFMPPHKRDVAMVFQSYALYPHKSVYENIAFGLAMRKYPKAEIDKRVRDAAARLHIDHLLKRRPNQLSGGQRQRVALGRAMVRQPAVFLMDEPLSNLDAALRVSMRAEIKDLHQSMQTTFVYVTHDQAEALTLADRIVVMSDGIVQQVGTPDEIYEQPRNMFVASFLGNPPINYLEGQLAELDGRIAFRRGGLTLALNAAASAKLAGNAGREVVLGLRPEDVDDRSAPVEGGAIDGHVNFVMPIGSDQFLNMKLEGEELFFRVGKETRHRNGEEVTLAANLDRLHLFDPETENSLLWT
jgi:multiple sugar transport system ATP-binding protein